MNEDELPAPFYDSREEYNMAKITNQELYNEIRELRTVLLGVPDSDDMGLYGECKDMRKLLKEINGKSKSCTSWVSALKWVVGLLALGLLATLTGQIGLW